MLPYKITEQFNFYLKVRVTNKIFEHAVDILPHNIRLLIGLRQHELAREIRINSKRMTNIEQARVLYPMNGSPDTSTKEIRELMLYFVPSEAVDKGRLQEDLQFTKYARTGMGTKQ